MEAYPLGLIQEVQLRSRATTRRGGLNWPRLRRYFRRAYGVVFDYRVAERNKILFGDHDYPSELPDALLFDSCGGEERFRVVPADPAYLRSTSDPSVQYRRLRCFLHEFAHVLELCHREFALPRAHRFVLEAHNTGLGAAQVSALDGAAFASTLEDPARDRDDPTYPLKELIHENRALMLFAWPRAVGEVIRARDTSNVDIALRFGISIEDVQRYLDSLLMCSDCRLAEAGVTVTDIKRFLSRPHYDPVAALARLLVGETYGPKVPERLVNAPIYDLDHFADDFLGPLFTMARQLEREGSGSPMSSAVPDWLESCVRQHSGSELRFLVRRAPRLFGYALTLIESCRPLRWAAITALLCAKLGFPRQGIHALASVRDAEKDPRLLEVRGFCHLVLGTPEGTSEDDARALDAYRRALELDPEDPEVRFGYGKSLLRVRGLEAAEAALASMRGPTSWLEWYLLGKIAFLHYNRTHNVAKLSLAEERLRAAVAEDGLKPALDLDCRAKRWRTLPWPPQFADLVSDEGLPLDSAQRAASELLDIDGDRKKAINLLAKVLEIRARTEGRRDLQLLTGALLYRSWASHKLDSKTNFCLYALHDSQGDSASAVGRLRELLHLRPADLNVWKYLRTIIRREFGEWSDFANDIDRLIERRN